MNETKLVKILKTFTISEFREFEKFVDSSFFSQGRDLSEFFKCLKTFFPDFKSEKYNAENIYLKLYPGKKFNEKTSVNILHKLSSELYSMCKEFLIQKGLDEDIQSKKYYLLQKLREKKLYKEFEKEYNASELETDYVRKGGVDDFLNKYFLRNCYTEYCIESGKVEDALNSISATGEYAAIAALILGYRNPDVLSNAVSINIALENNLTDVMIEHLDSEGFLKQLKRDNNKYYPYVELNFAIYKLGKNPEENENYFLLKNLFDKYIHLLGRTEKFVLLSIMSSHCIRNLYGKNSEMFTAEEFNIYKKSIELELYKYNENDSFDLTRFRNIVNSAFSLKQIDWLEKFTEDYINELSPGYRENMNYYSRSFICFGKKEYGKALENLNKLSYDYFLFKTDVKKLMLEIYYEKGYYEEAFSMLDTMKHYISKTKDLSESFKLRDVNFMKFINELLKIRTSKNTKDILLLEDKIKKEYQVSSKSWILEKIKELKQ